MVQILSGRDTGWNPQRRDDGSIPLKSIARRHRSHVVMGFVALIAAGAAVALAGALDVADDRRPHPRDSDLLGERPALDRRCAAARRPADDAGGDAPPPIIARANALAEELAQSGHDDEDGLRR